MTPKEIDELSKELKIDIKSLSEKMGFNIDNPPGLYDNETDISVIGKNIKYTYSIYSKMIELSKIEPKLSKKEIDNLFDTYIVEQVYAGNIIIEKPEEVTIKRIK